MSATITTTLGALASAEPALQTLCALKLSAKSAYHLQKLARLGGADIAHFHEARNALITELGAKRADGLFEIKPNPDHLGGGEPWQQFVAKVNELAAVPVEIPWSPITLDMFGDEKVSAADLQALGPLFAEPEGPS